MLKLGAYFSFAFIVWNLYESQANIMDAEDVGRELQDKSNAFLTKILQLEKNNEKRIKRLETQVEAQEALIMSGIPFRRSYQHYSEYFPKETRKFEQIGARRFYISDNHFPDSLPVAEAICREMGGSLVAIKDQAELDAINAKINNNSRFWLGINDRKNNGTYVSQATGKEAPFLKWRSGEPNNKGGDEHCVELLDGVMNDVPCSMHLFTICQEGNSV
ncbi:C-type lectin 37Db-like [Drosophila elegans]|uniref:C-type lectin 37Db-like n=1 Tax=Drosophila elegans TaxID=30023 RepID=UPI001BC84148|nr:C-type lectin 37Db-like [Drosophila elegans]